MKPTVVQWIVIVWFTLSVPLHVIGNIVFYVWLRSRGAHPSIFWASLPGYLDAILEQEIKKGRLAPSPWSQFRRFTVVNMVLAIVFFFLLGIMRLR